MKKGTKKSGPKKEGSPKVKSSVSVIKVLQKEYTQLVKQRKEIDEEIKKFEAIFKLMGAKLKKRSEKTETQPETEKKTGKKRGRKKKEAETVVEKPEEIKEETH